MADTKGSASTDRKNGSVSKNNDYGDCPKDYDTHPSCCEKKSKSYKQEKSISDKTASFAETVSLVGLTHVAKSTRKGRKLVWTFWLAVGLALAIYQIQERFVYYFSYPTNTEFHIKTTDELSFPQVTICKEDWMSKTKAYQPGIGQNVEAQLKLIEDLFADDKFNATQFAIEYTKLTLLIYNSTQNWGTKSKQLSHDWKDLVKSVKWDGEANDSRSLVQEIKTDLGYCFTIGAVPKRLKVTQPGLRFGLEIYLNARQWDSIPMSYSGHEIFAGFRVLIHDPSEVPRMLETGFVLTPGTVTQVALTFENVTQQGPPYSDCIPKPNYRFVTCLASCEDDFFLNQCKCRPFYYDGKQNISVCSYLAHEECLDKYQKSRKTSGSSQCNCGQQCYSPTYLYSLSQSKISSTILKIDEAATRAEIRELQVNFTVNNTEPDVTIINIYFPYMQYNEITSSESYSLFALFCDVGGALSLLLGATLLTLYEVLEFLVIIAAKFLRGWRTKRNITTQAPQKA